MKTPVAVTLIGCGTLLVALPMIHNAILMALVQQTMVVLQKDVNLSSDLPLYVTAACFLIGLAMILVGALGGCQAMNPRGQAE